MIGSFYFVKLRIGPFKLRIGPFFWKRDRGSKSQRVAKPKLEVQRY